MSYLADEGYNEVIPAGDCQVENVVAAPATDKGFKNVDHVDNGDGTQSTYYTTEVLWTCAYGTEGMCALCVTTECYKWLNGGWTHQWNTGPSIFSKPCNFDNEHLYSQANASEDNSSGRYKYIYRYGRPRTVSGQTTCDIFYWHSIEWTVP